MTSAQPFNFDGFFDPPSQPEVTHAYRWHEAGEHEDFRLWAKRGCEACEEKVDTLVIKVELEFSYQDLATAKHWFERYGEKYKKPANDHELLLLWSLAPVVDHYREIE